jgi:membrane-associated phospholipid phosphatase
MLKKLTIICMLMLAARPGFAIGWGVESIGDMLQFVVPAMALGMTIQEDTWDGTIQFAEVFGASMLTELAFKSTIHQMRPNGANNAGFPSGHTLSAFSGATFIHRRYGLKRAVIPYLAAGFVAYSRVDSKWHAVDDVIAGAIFAGIWSMVFAERLSPNITVAADAHGASLRFKTKF